MAKIHDTIFTYGGGEALEAILNGVAMVFNSGLGATIISTMTLVAIAWAAIQGIMQQSFVPKISWLVKYTLITTLLITPKTSVSIYDTIDARTRKIDNLPVGLVLPASMISTFGYGITKVFEQAFAAVDDLSYSKYGTSFGAGMIANARNYKIQDSVFRENINSFIDNCVLYDVMIGHKYTPSEMRDSTKIWELVSSNASNIRMFNYRDGKIRSLTTCRDGANKMGSYWNDDISNLAGRFSGSIFSRMASTTTSSDKISSNTSTENQAFLGKTFLNNLGVVSNFYGNKSSASENLQQLMMINAMADMPASYGAMRAKQQQQESWQITGELAREYLPIMHSVFAGLIYASFVLILGLLVLPGGFRVFGSYLGLLAWIELWPPLFAVLNLIVNLSSRAAGDQIGSGFTMNNISQIVTTQTSISSLAGYFMISIPFIALTIVKGGASQFMHLAGQLTSATQSAATGAAGEVTSGNRSFDNHSLSSSQRFNSNGFKTDHNSSHRSGQREEQMSDGTIVKNMSSGETVFNSGAGITTSTGSKQMSMSNVDTSAMHQSIGAEKSNMNSKQMELNDSQQSTTSIATEYLARVAEGETSGEHFNHGKNSSASSQFQDAVSKTKDLHERYGHNWQQAAAMTLSGTVGGGVRVAADKSIAPGPNTGITPAAEQLTSHAKQYLPEPISPDNNHAGNGANLSVGASAHADMAVSGKLDAIKSSEQSLGEQRGYNLAKGYTNMIDSVVRASQEMQYNTNQSEEKALADSLRGSYETTKSLRDSISVSQQNIDRHQSSIDHSNANSFTVNDEMYHKELHYIAEQKDHTGFRYGEKQAHRMIESGGSAYEELHKGFMSKYVPNQRMPSNGVHLDQQYESAAKLFNDNNKVDDSSMAQVKNHAKGQIKEQLVSKEAASSVMKQEGDNEYRIKNKQRDLHLEGQKAQVKVNEAEEKRLGKWGWFKFGRANKKDQIFDDN